MPYASPSRTALITGASRGIGRAIAVALGSRGFNVAVNYFRNAEAAHETVAQVEQAGGKAVAVQADVGRELDRQRLVAETLDQFGAIDVLVNNAGIPPAVRADILETTEDVWDRVLDTNLKGPFFLTQLVARGMVGEGTGDRRQGTGDRGQETGDRGQRAEGGGRRAEGGPKPGHSDVPDQVPTGNTQSPFPNPQTPLPAARAIINIGSLSAYAATTARSQYCIAKAGMRMMTDLFAARLARDGINVYEICPGVIDTDMARGAKDKYDQLIHEGDLLPIARWGRADDVAKAVLAIVDGYLPYSTGTVIDVDGGYRVRRL
mgnify:CR=1 FL=1